MAKYDAYIVYHDGQYVVRPAFAVVPPSGKFTIYNMTDFADAEVTLPITKVKNANGHKQSTSLAGGIRHLTFDLGTAGETFAYQVVVDGYSAVGESDPVIIIDP